MAAHRKAEQFVFPFQAFASGGFHQRDFRQPFHARRGEQPALLRIEGGAKGAVEELIFPKLRRAGLAESVKGTDAQESFHLLGRRRHAPMKVAQG